MVNRPPFESLPLNKDDPPFSAWGLYGKDDQLGALNMLTPERIVEAAKEIKTGVRVGLNLPLNVLPSPPSFGRKGVHQHIISKYPRCVHDDELSFNTQVYCIYKYINVLAFFLFYLFFS